MKKLLPAVVALAMITAACGASGEEKQAQQEEAEAQVDEKVNEIMDQLDESGNAEGAMETDSASMDAGMEEHSHEGEGHDHAH
ncbi:MAG: hypothetical protein R2813_06120 [Flavobacteriales bacterium]